MLIKTEKCLFWGFKQKNVCVWGGGGGGGGV